jgi:hypothetical protein
MRRIALITALAALVPVSQAAAAGTTLLLDRPAGLGGLPFDGLNYSISPGPGTLSDDGRLAVFESDSDALLAPGADPEKRHVFVRDRQAKTTLMVDTATNGTPGNGGANEVAISGDGTRVAFASASDNLVPGSNQALNVYVKDLATGAVALASRETGANGSVATGACTEPVLDTDGSTVAFRCGSKLDPADTNGGVNDIYVRDLTNATTTLISRATGANGAVGAMSSTSPAISGDGAKVVFETENKLDVGKDPNTSSDVYMRSGSTTTLISRVGGANTPAAGNSGTASITTDGGRVAFVSGTDGLVAGDANTFQDVFVRNVNNNTTILVSRPDGSANGSADGESSTAVISGMGGRVAFTSSAKDLTADTPGGTNYTFYGFVRTITTNETVLMSRADGANGEPRRGSLSSLSADGLVALFTANLTPNSDHVLVYTRSGAATDAVSVPTGATTPAGATSGSFSASGQAITANGRYAVFASGSDGLSDGDLDDVEGNAFLRDRKTNAVRVLDTGANGPADHGSSRVVISADGTHAAFETYSTNLGGNPTQGAIYVEDLATGELELASRADGAGGALAAGEGFNVTISADGHRISFITATPLDPVHDTNADNDAYVRDVVADTTTLVSRADGAGTNAGNKGTNDATIDAAGDRVVFTSRATDLGDGAVTAANDVHVRDLSANTTVLASRADGAAGAPGDQPSDDADISADGTRVVFVSQAQNLGDGDATAAYDVHVRDLAAQTTTLVSREGAAGPAGSKDSYDPVLSEDGKTVAFSTGAPNLLPAGSGEFEVLVRDLASGDTVLGSRANGVAGAPAAGYGARNPSLSGDGGCLAFDSPDPGLEPVGYPSADWFHAHVRTLSGDCPAAGGSGTPTPTPTPTGTPAPETVAPVISGLRATRKRVRFALSEAASVSVTIKRGRSKRVLRRARPAGKVQIKLGRRLRKAGRYKLRLAAADAAGNVSTPARAKVRVRRKRVPLIHGARH